MLAVGYKIPLLLLPCYTCYTVILEVNSLDFSKSFEEQERVILLLY